MNFVATSTLRNNLADTLNVVSNTEDYMIILGRGRKPRAALVNLDLFEDLLDSNDHEYLASIKKAREEAKNGEIYTMDEAFGKV